jgi:hypothetical protein
MTADVRGIPTSNLIAAQRGNDFAPLLPSKETLSGVYFELRARIDRLGWHLLVEEGTD